MAPVDSVAAIGVHGGSRGLASVSGLVDRLRKPVLEVRAIEPLRKASEHGRVELRRSALEAIHRLADGFHRRFADQEPRLAIADDVECAPFGACEHRLARRERFDHHHAEIVHSRMQKGAAAREKRRKLALLDPRQKRRVRARETLESRSLGPLADDHESLAPPVECAQRKIDSLVRDERGDEQVGSVRIGRGDALGGPLEAVRLDRWLDHLGVALVVAEDSLARVRAVGDEYMRACSGRGLPTTQVRGRAAKQGAPDVSSGNARLVRALGFVRITERRVDVGDVQRRGGSERADGDAVAARDDQRVAVELEGLDGKREKRQQRAKTPAHEGRIRDAMNRGCGGLPPGEIRR